MGPGNHLEKITVDRSGIGYLKFVQRKRIWGAVNRFSINLVYEVLYNMEVLHPLYREYSAMPTKTDWKIEINLDEMGEAASMKRVLASPTARADCESALADVLRLIRPAAIWEAHPIREFMHHKIVLENGAKIAGGPVADVLAGSTVLIVGVCTVGRDVCDAAMEARRGDRKLYAMFLDMFGGAAVGLIRQQWTDLMQAETHAQGLHHSAMLSPGESTWPVDQQQVLFTLVDAASIGVSLTETMMMSPVKSLSMILGTSPNPIGSEGGTNCDYCTMRDTCEHSQASSRRPAPQHV
jgi:hypothetical protein